MSRLELPFLIKKDMALEEALEAIQRNFDAIAGEVDVRDRALDDVKATTDELQETASELVDRLVEGLTVGGEESEEGILQVLDELGEVSGELSSVSSSFGELFVGDLSSPSIVQILNEDRTVWVDPVNGSDDNDGLGPGDYIDTFTRTEVDAWGISDSGHQWDIIKGSNTVFDVDGSQGTILTTDAGDSRDIRALWGGAKDVEVFTTFQYDKVPTGAGGLSIFQCRVRLVDVDNWFNARLEVPTTGNMTLGLVERAAGSNTTLVTQTDTGVAPSANTDFSLRVQIFEESDETITLRARVWDAGQAEPSTWIVEINGAVSKHGDDQHGIACNSNASITNSPITWKFTDWQVRAMEVSEDDINFLTGLPVSTLQHAVDEIPAYIAANANINVVPGSVLEEAIDITGIIGTGIFTVNGYQRGGSFPTTLTGKVLVEGCAAQVLFKKFEVQDDGSTTTPTVNVHAARYVTIEDCNVQGNGVPNSVIRVENGSQAQVSGCDARGASNTGASSALSVQGGSVVQWFTNTGVGPASGFGIRNNGAIAFLANTNPSGGNSTVNAGQTFGAYTTAGGTGAGASTKQTKYFSAKKTQSWRPSGWRTDNDHVYEGDYGWGNHKGCWFYKSQNIRDALAGKTIKSISIFVPRRDGGGSSSAQSIRAYHHPHGNTPGGEPSLSSGTNIGSLKWGEGKWLKLPNSFGNALRDNNAKGIAIFQSNGSPYVICKGKSESNKTGQLKITFE